MAGNLRGYDDDDGQATDPLVARAAAGDMVLLAPAAASMDMFRDYGARGDAFVAAVARASGAGDGTSEEDR